MAVNHSTKLSLVYIIMAKKKAKTMYAIGLVRLRNFIAASLGRILYISKETKRT